MIISSPSGLFYNYPINVCIAPDGAIVVCALLVYKAVVPDGAEWMQYSEKMAIPYGIKKSVRH